MPIKGKLYIAFITAAGAAILVHSLLHWEQNQVPRFVFYLLFAICASQLKVRLPGVTGTMSVSYVFVLIAATCLSVPETILVACGSAAAQSLLKTKQRPQPIQLCFNLSSATVSAWVACLAWNSQTVRGIENSVPVLLFWASVSYFAVNTLSVSAVIALTEGKRVLQTWYESFFWTAPQYIVGAAIAWLMIVAAGRFGWQPSV